MLLVRKGAGHTLRRGADRVEEGVAGPDDGGSTWDRLVLERGSMGLADEVLGYGADVVRRGAAAAARRASSTGSGRPSSAAGRPHERRAASAKDQVARLLTLVPYLHAHGEVRLDEAAAAARRRPGQLLGDLKVLFMCGLPGGYPDDLIDVDIDALEGPTAYGPTA